MPRRIEGWSFSSELPLIRTSLFPAEPPRGDVGPQAKMSLTTWPSTSVSRKFRPLADVKRRHAGRSLKQEGNRICTFPGLQFLKPSDRESRDDLAREIDATHAALSEE